MRIEVVNTSYNPLPCYAREGDAGMDLRAWQAASIPPLERHPVRTGLRVAIPDGHVGLVWPRSGLAVKHGIDVMAGVIDSGFRGEICVVLVNHNADTFVINPGDRIAQLLIQPVAKAELVPVESLDDTERGTGGFGSTGAA